MRLSLRKQKNRGPLRGLVDRVVWRLVDELKEFPGNPRRHPESQITGLMKSIGRFWTNPILVDEAGTILAGHGRWEAARASRHDRSPHRYGQRPEHFRETASASWSLIASSLSPTR